MNNKSTGEFKRSQLSNSRFRQTCFCSHTGHEYLSLRQKKIMF